MTTSTFGWLDHSEAQRRQMLEIVGLFRDKGTLDELGFGSIRDAFSDYFFPGITTIQTRARYYLFVPWIHLHIERENFPYAQMESAARTNQARLAIALQRGGEGEAQGVIGIQAGELLRRTPADIYWGGLRRFGIWRFRGSLAQYYSSPRRRITDSSLLRSDEGEWIERGETGGWDPALPAQPAELLAETTFRLTLREANYLSERITLTAPGSLLVYCVRGDPRLEKIDFPWLHPQLAEFPLQLQRDLDQAHRFSVASYGATLLYNIMLAERATEFGLPIPDGLGELRDKMEEWATSDETRSALRNWDLIDLWRAVSNQGHQITHPTRLFVQALVATMQTELAGLADASAARRLIERREVALKGGLARLGNRRALERLTGPVGLSRQAYRWSNVKRILADVHQAMRVLSAA